MVFQPHVVKPIRMLEGAIQCYVATATSRVKDHMQRLLLGILGKGKNVEVVLLWLGIPPLRDTVVLVAQDLSPASFEVLDQLHLGSPETDLF